MIIADFRLWHINVKCSAFVENLIRYHGESIYFYALGTESKTNVFVKYECTAKPKFQKDKCISHVSCFSKIQSIFRVTKYN